MIKKIFSVCQKIKIKRVYLQYFLALFFTALIFVLIIGVVTYFITTASLIDQISQQKTNTLVQTKNSSDISLKEIEKQVISKTVDPVFARLNFYNAENKYTISNDVYRILVDCRNSNENIFSVYCYMPDEEYIITSEDGRWSTDDFYDTSWLGNDFKKDNSIYWMPTREVRTYAGERIEIFSLLMPVQTDKSDINKDPFILVNIKSQKYAASVIGSTSMEFEKTLIVDNSKNMIAGSNNIQSDFELLPLEIDKRQDEKHVHYEHTKVGESYLISYAVSDYNGWKYICLTPKKEIMKSVAYIKMIFLGVVGLCIFLGVFVAIMTSKKIYKPISDLMISVKNYCNKTTNDKENEIVFLNREFGKIAEENRDLFNTLHESESLIKDGYIKDLIENSANSEDDLILKSRLCNISFPYQHYYVLSLSMDKLRAFKSDNSEEEKNVVFEGLNICVKDLINTKDIFGLFTPIERGGYVIIFNTDKNDDFIEKTADKLRDDIKNILCITVTVGISKRFSQLTEACNAYCQSLEAVNKRVLLGGDRVILFKELLNNTKYFRLSAFKNHQIMNCIRNANIEEVTKILNKTVSMVQKDPSYPNEDIINFFYFIIGQCVKTINENGWSINDVFHEEYDLYKELINNENIYDMSEWIHAILKKMSAFMLGKKETRNQQTIKNILDYMHKNYEKDISLYSIADSVYLSPTYISKIFKEATGKNFVKYLTEIRVEKAKCLLRQSKYKISQVGELVNLGNTQNFIRIFKKYEGCTPGQYRESFIKNNLMIS